MNLYQQHLDRLAKLAFGPSAHISGSFGTVQQPGELRLHLDGEQIGSGRTWQEALTAASRQLASITRAVAPAVVFIVVALL
jgi:hypothetical protein